MAKEKYTQTHIQCNTIHLYCGIIIIVIILFLLINVKGREKKNSESERGKEGEREFFYLQTLLKIPALVKT